jgi:hypothetical protein
VSGAFGGEFGGALGVESGELLELSAKGGDLVGEPEVLFIEGAGALDEGGGAPVPEKPGDDSAEYGSEESEDDERHVRDGRGRNR